LCFERGGREIRPIYSFHPVTFQKTKSLLWCVVQSTSISVRLRAQLVTQPLNRSVTQWVTVRGYSMTRCAYSMTRPKFSRYDTATVIDLGWSIKRPLLTLFHSLNIFLYSIQLLLVLYFFLFIQVPEIFQYSFNNFHYTIQL
jgi:hypothetical protein